MKFKQTPFSLPIFLLISSAMIFTSSRVAAAAPAPTSTEVADGDHEVVPLWPKGFIVGPNALKPEKVRLAEGGEHVFSSVHRPSITVYLPEKSIATGTSVIVIPGGGHKEIWMDHEGYNVARWLAAHGVAAFVIKYRLAREDGSAYHVEVESLQDVQRAIRVVRNHSTAWGIDPKRVGVIGFSAGGELAALASMRGDTGHAGANDLVEHQSALPDFQALIYPGNAKAIQPTKSSPPAFLVCGEEDRDDISDELENVYHRFKKAGVPVELHIYSGIGHGFGLRSSLHAPAASWPDRFLDWLGERGFLKK